MAHLMETQLESTVVYDGRIIRVEKDTVLLEDGTQAIREVVRHPGGVCVVAQKDNGKIIMVDYNDLFGMNYAEQMKKRNIAAIDNRIATVQASYEEYCAKIEAAKLTGKTEAKKEAAAKK